MREASELVRFHVRDGVAEVRLDRPERRNAIDLRFARQLDAVFRRVEADDAVRVALLTASGPAFCAGQDLKALGNGEAEAFIDGAGWAAITHRKRSKPLMAAVQGPALAGGFEIVLAADLVVASEDATFGLPEIHHGLLAAAGGAARLPLRIAPAVALEILLTGDPISAEKALSLGLINRVVDRADLHIAAMGLAVRLAMQPPEALRAALKVAHCAVSAGERPADNLANRLLAELHAGKPTFSPSSRNRSRH